jgi:3-hexulose-6-phosphate synthase
MAPVRAFKARFPDLKVLADVKIMDAGEIEAGASFDAGQRRVAEPDHVGVTPLAVRAGVDRPAKPARRLTSSPR